MIWSRTGGAGTGPLLVMLHGLGATAEVFAEVERELSDNWSGGWLVVDLPGHGRSGWDPPYSFAGLADAVRPLLPHDRDLVLLGHSLGGVVALHLADGAAPAPSAVIALGVKVRWTEEDLGRAAKIAERPVLTLASREEAVDRYLKLAGLSGLVDATDQATDAGVVAATEGWRVAQDPATFAVGAPDMTGLLAGAVCPVAMARGEHDPMVSDRDLAALVPDPVTLRGLGHNAHVEDPGAVLAVVRRVHGP
ncbi:alpha/beta fold hydrolase [Nocardioides seonyuensis]|uniref:Alpha/beta fold hydrolase n=1 Tax=Nocardioides seonyuensis TaxID=2518371 RepID=A0A4P7IHB7_9ACTN|nr:alpha/beta fold hydrolase [Nocardioides seonyuensis]QBX55537.1 alpha/beta fold hydrolase [Nocardioides seonyuensis]